MQNHPFHDLLVSKTNTFIHEEKKLEKKVNVPV